MPKLNGHQPADRDGRWQRIFGSGHTDVGRQVVDPGPTHFADAIPKDAVVFVSQPKGYISACWGGLMSTRVRKLGAAGVVIDDRFRDVHEHCEFGLGLFACGVSILGSNTFTRSSELKVQCPMKMRKLADK